MAVFETDKEAQVAWSIILIAAITIMVPVYFGCTAADNRDEMNMLLYTGPTLTVLLIGYMFTYRGKEHLLSRIIFGISLVVSLVVYFICAAMMGLAQAFSHG
jgi:hypothetical protein